MNLNQIKLTAVRGNSLRLDGGAMFGNAPKALWQRWIPADEFNMIPIASRGLLIESPYHTLLFETGCGAYLSPDMKKRYQVQESDHILLDSLSSAGVSHDQVTHIILSHLHFDHAGGLFKAWDEHQDELALMFPNASFIVGEEQFDRAKNPHPRDRASFIPELCGLLEQSGRLIRVRHGDTLNIDNIGVEWIQSDGHTPGMMMSKISLPEQVVYFVGDLAPGSAWINLPITMGYDRFPEGLIDEKKNLFKKAVKEDAWIFYTHDDQYAASKLVFDSQKGRYLPVNTIPDFNGVSTLGRP